MEHIAAGKENQCRQYSSNHTKQDCLDMKALRSSGKRESCGACLFVCLFLNDSKLKERATWRVDGGKILKLEVHILETDKGLWEMVK